MVTRDEVLLPRPGDSVEVAWGLEHVYGRVVESYATGTRPRVVVELNAGEVSEGSTTVTVPLGSVRPVGSLTSPWGHWRWYERELANAIQRVTQGRFRLTLSAEGPGDEGLDMALNLGGGYFIAVELKLGKPLSMRAATSAIHKLGRLRQKVVAKESGEIWLGLLVADQRLPRGLESTNEFVKSVCWRGPGDDRVLRNEIYSLLSAAGWRDPDRGARFEIYADKAGKYRFRLKAANGETVAVGEAYESKEAARRAVEAMYRASAAAELPDDLGFGRDILKQGSRFEIYADKAGKYRFRLKAANGETVAVGEAYESKEAARRAVEAVRRAVPRAKDDLKA